MVPVGELAMPVAGLPVPSRESKGQVAELFWRVHHFAAAALQNCPQAVSWWRSHSFQSRALPTEMMCDTRTGTPGPKVSQTCSSLALP